MSEAVERPPPKPVRKIGSRLGRYLDAHVALVLTALVGGLLVTGLTAASALVYDAVEDKNGISGLDQPALHLAISLRTRADERIITAFTQLGGPIGMSIIASAITIVMVWRWRAYTPPILMAIGVAGSLTFTTVGKAIVGRVRPPLSEAVPPYEYAFSFPSGHTVNSTVIAGLVAYLVARRLKSRVGRILCGLAAVVWSVAMGLSRVFLGHHWLTDVIFAWLLGLAWVGLLITAHQIFLIANRVPARRRPVGEPAPG